MHPLAVAAFDCRFRARQPMRMPGYMGSAWRGGFGRALKRAVCVTGLPTCPGCQFEAHCVYPYLFETAPGGEDGILAGYATGCRTRSCWRRPGTTAGCVLIGRAIEHAVFARQAVVEAGLRGLGPDRGRSTRVAADSVALPPTSPCPERVEIALLTPLRLVEAGRPVGPGALRPRHLLMALLRRISSLAERHGRASLDLDYRALKERAEPAEFAAADLRWVEWARSSGRQQTLLRMGGLLGSLALPLAGLEAFWPFLALAPLVHVGKGATMGLGAMRVSPA